MSIPIVDNIAESLLSTVGKIADLIRSGRSNSLTEYTQSAHILPVFLTDTSFSHMPEAETIIGGTLNYYAAVYLMAAQMSVNIGDVNIIGQLEKLNNRRSPIEAGTTGLTTLLSMESYQNGLPNPRKAKIVPAIQSDPKYVAEASGSSNNDPHPDAMNGGVGRGVVDRVEANSKLSLGKTLEVHWESKGEKGVVVVSLRPSVQTTSDESMINILSIGAKNISFKERWHGVKSGALHWFYDGVLAGDVIREMRRKRIKDNTGYYIDAVNRARKNKLSGLLSLNPSVATYSSVFFITAETARELEALTNMSLSKPSDRDKMFENSFGMVLVVVDRSWKTCTIYSHKIPDATTVTFSQMDGANKGKNGDIKEIFNALMMSNAPRF